MWGEGPLPNVGETKRREEKVLCDPQYGATVLL